MPEKYTISEARLRSSVLLPYLTTQVMDIIGIRAQEYQQFVGGMGMRPVYRSG